MKSVSDALFAEIVKETMDLKKYYPQKQLQDIAENTIRTRTKGMGLSEDQKGELLFQVVYIALER